MKSVPYQNVVIGLFIASGVVAVLRWFHPAMLSLNTFSMLFLVSWVAFAGLFHQRSL